jgi:dipeptidyl-peptidase-4
MTLTLLLKNPEVFKAASCGGPVIDWQWYEIMYGERYMDRPEQIKEGYEKASLLNYADKLEGNLLLIHGTIDDVVVMQHNYALVKKFVDKGMRHR